VEFDPKFVYRADAPVQGKVAIISGGAVVMNRCMLGLSGWECSMLLVPEVFTSPTLIKCWQLPKGGRWSWHLYIVKNYSGDVMNFEMAPNSRPHGGPGAEYLIDEAVKDSLYTQGRRGVGTTVLAEKSVVRLLSRGDCCSSYGSLRQPEWRGVWESH